MRSRVAVKLIHVRSIFYEEIQGVPSEKAISLELFSAAEPGVSLSDLARRSRFDKASMTRRLLASSVASRARRTGRDEPAYRLRHQARPAFVTTHFPYVLVAAPLARELARGDKRDGSTPEFGAGSLLTVFYELSPRQPRRRRCRPSPLPLRTASVPGTPFSPSRGRRR